jgi:hypothetical protein
MPYIGVNSYQGERAEGLGPGLRLGVLLGGRIAPTLSLNGEFLIDVVNIKEAAGQSAASVEFAFSPLLHVPSHNIEFVVGPKIGAYALAVSLGENNAYYPGYDATLTYSGVVIGLNAGLFAELNPSMAIGGLFSFSIRKPTQVCLKIDTAGEECGDVLNVDEETDKVLGFNGALLF